MRKFCILILCCLFVRTGFAQQRSHLVLYDIHSTQVIIPLSDKPILTFGSDSLNINTDNVMLQFPINELARFAYEQREMSTGTTPLLIENDVTIENDILLLHTRPNEKAFLFTISGTALADYCADSNGDISVPLFDLADGVYIMHYNGISFKFRK